MIVVGVSCYRSVNRSVMADDNDNDDGDEVGDWDGETHWFDELNASSLRDVVFDGWKSRK